MIQQLTIKTAPSFVFAIYMAGDIDQAKQICREYCFKIGLCVTIEPITYIYTGGEESGFRVGLINYPRFPSEPQEIKEKVNHLAMILMEKLCQHSYSFVGPIETVWVSRRPEN